MADHTHIEWTDATWNPITGCSVVSPGCTNCYAMKLAGTRLQHHWSRKGLTRQTKAGPVWTGEVRLNADWLDQPLRWKKPRRIFVCAHGDLFHESVPDAWIDQVFAVMALAPQHTFQVLTKRAERMRQFINELTFARIIAASDGLPAEKGTIPTGVNIWKRGNFVLPNVWLGVSVEDQARADERIPLLLDTPAAVRWISAEPLLGSIDIEKFVHDSTCGLFRGDICTCCDPYEIGLDWVVAGGESGPDARPMHPEWARSLRDQCGAAGVPFLFKQWGEWAPDAGPAVDGRDRIMDGAAQCAVWHRDRWTYARNGYEPKSGAGIGEWVYRVGKKAAGRMLDGVLHDGYPETGACVKS